MTVEEKTKLLKFIKEGKVQQAIENLLSAEIDESTRKETLAISSKFQKLKKNNKLGILTFEQANVTEGQIVSHLIDIINRPSGKAFPIEKSITTTNTSKPIIWKYITAAAIVIGILGSLAEVLNFINIFPANGKNEKKQLTVFVTDSEGNVVLENEGRLNIPLGNRSLNAMIGENGRTNFPDITANNLGDTILIGLKVKGWEIIDDKNTFVFTGDPINLKVKKDKSLGTIKGVVKTRDGQDFISGAQILINMDTTILTDELGIFKIILPESLQVNSHDDYYKLTVSKEGFLNSIQNYYPLSSGVEIRLETIK